MFYFPVERQPLVEEKKAKPKKETTQGKTQLKCETTQGTNQKRLGGLDNGHISMQTNLAVSAMCSCFEMRPLSN